jgi:hypothetical protein
MSHFTFYKARGTEMNARIKTCLIIHEEIGLPEVSPKPEKEKENNQRGTMQVSVTKITSTMCKIFITRQKCGGTIGKMWVDGYGENGFFPMPFGKCLGESV